MCNLHHKRARTKNTCSYCKHTPDKLGKLDLIQTEMRLNKDKGSIKRALRSPACTRSSGRCPVTDRPAQRQKAARLESSVNRGVLIVRGGLEVSAKYLTLRHFSRREQPLLRTQSAAGQLLCGERCFLSPTHATTTRFNSDERQKRSDIPLVIDPCVVG